MPWINTSYNFDDPMLCLHLSLQSVLGRKFHDNFYSLTPTWPKESRQPQLQLLEQAVLRTIEEARPHLKGGLVLVGMDFDVSNRR